jgi:AcrR family transcriptional regulator
MSEVAELAGISIGSLYQYFPDKSAIIRTLAERYNAESWQLGEATMRLAISLDPSEGDAIVDAYKRMTLRELSEIRPGGAGAPRIAFENASSNGE